MAYWHIERWMKHLYPDVVWDFYGKKKTIYLTFDDGPTPVITVEVLKLLDEYNAKATFFCLGRNAERHPDLFRNILNGGHSVGNHTYSHLKGWGLDNNTYFDDITLASIFIKSPLFRPPYGQIRRSQINFLKDKYRIILWDVMSHDYESRISKEKSFKKLIHYIRDGSIIVFHDSVKAWPKLKYILPEVLKHFSEKGYLFDRID